MNRIVSKYIISLSLLVGLIFGVFAFIPYLGGISLFLTLFLIAPIVIILLIMSGKADLSTPQDSIINGALSGFLGNITFSFAYCIVDSIFYLTLKYTSNLFLTAMIINSPVWLLIMVVLFIGVLTAVTNAFSGFLTYYIINLIRDLYENKHHKED